MGRMTLIVGNSGNKVASDVKVRLAHVSNQTIGKAVRELELATGIGQIAPGARRRYSLIFRLPDLLPKEGQPTTLDFEILYRDGRRKVHDRQRIDFSGYQRALFDRDDIGMADIYDALNRIAGKMPERVLHSSFSAACPYCGTGLSASATKCSGCLEWLPEAKPRRIRRPSAAKEVATQATPSPARTRPAKVNGAKITATDKDQISTSEQREFLHLAPFASGCRLVAACRNGGRPVFRSPVRLGPDLA